MMSISRTAKTVLTALWGVCSACSLQAETIYSDIVGVQKVTLGEGWNFVAMPFVPEANTLAAVLGTNQLPSAANAASATVVDVWDQDGQALTNRYWLSNAPGFEGWRVAPNFDAANDQAVDIKKGMLITVREGQGPKEILLAGTVPTVKAEQVIKGGGYSLAASPFPQEIALNQSGLAESGFGSGANRITADNLKFYNPASDRYDTVYLHTSGDWKNAADNSVTTRKIKPGESFLVRRRVQSDMTWTNPVPYSLP